MPKPFSLASAFGMPPKDAVAYFRAKGYAVSDNWWEVWQASHARAFTVAKAMRMDVLTTIRAELDRAMSQGRTADQFAKDLAPTLKKLGWWGKQIWADAAGNAQEVQLGSMHRLRNIYRVNMQTAYMAGRYREQLANVDDRPYWMYVAIKDSQTRPSHARLNGRIFRYDDPIWKHIYPPNGWGCRCRVRALTEAQLKKLGRSVENGAGYIEEIKAEAGVDKRTGEVITVDHVRINLPGGKSMQPDVGWAYSPGEAGFGTDMAIAQKLAQAKDIDLRSQLIQSLNNSELRQAQFANWVDKALENRRAGNSVQTLGFMQDSIRDVVNNKLGIEASYLMAISEKELLHADSPKHQAKGVTLSATEYQQLPLLLQQAEAVLWDKANNNLMYVLPSVDGQAIKIIVNANWQMKKQPQLLNAVINVYKVQWEMLGGDQYEVIQGKLSR